MSVTFNAATYTAEPAVSPDNQPYRGPNHTVSTVDKLVFKRQLPKPTPTFRGVARAEAKATRTVVIDSAGATSSLYGAFHMDVPVGTSLADVQSMIADFAAWLVTQSAEDLFFGIDVLQ